MTTIAEYRKKLRELKDWDAYLLAESGLPGPRANLSLVNAAADEGDEAQFEGWLSNTPETAPSNTAGEFLALCGVVGLGKLLAGGQSGKLKFLRGFASDPRWRLREGVAMALQRWGDNDMDALIDAMESWSSGNLLEQRAAAAALCEPRLLKQAAQVERVLHILDHITLLIKNVEIRKGDDFIALRKGLAYCWSVAVAAHPASGKPLMEKWFASEDKDIRWIMKENLKKDRLKRMDADWVQGGVKTIA